MMIDCDLLLCWGAIHRKVIKGQAIFYEGDNALFYYQVVRGRVKMVNTNEEGKEFIQGFFGDGDAFGEPPLFDGNGYPATAIAEEDTILIRLRKDNFLQLLKDNFEIHFAFTQLLASRLRFKSILSKELSCHGPEPRITTLIHLFKHASNVPDHMRYKVNLTRQQIADMTGLRVETVIRVIRVLYGKGRVLLEKGKIYV
ncbi:Crp/Fnr family transcriptional regulator [Flavitalea sp. BT771]|uniref:Crp/Fnr family transcriptional regulator n=1 Tax=Flavitalea sp. BT771 TaxID=3063329 RepID=UPI0026E221F8|nr:Crp/Fnr family transcriptional regulator [Flavitalea sp. BT771]MDO6430573.1 Crp/Fnr family transcriptional regulator [Flavitalea sp. BT771]MDV6219287.1 Crp/Fnr family transcriptional regulator [Flavitalea sp. BT771]